MNQRFEPILHVGVVIPIYQPGEVFRETLESLFLQTHAISRIVIIDSSPLGQDARRMVDQNGESASSEKIKYTRISPLEFDHGGTRNLGVKVLSGEGEIDAILFLTQDAVLALDCLARLMQFMEANDLAACFARQLPRKGASELEIAERSKRYPAESRVISGGPQSIDDVFFSNVCSLIRLNAFEACAGFPEQIIMAEDMVFASRLLEQGLSVGYCAEARVQHSHFQGFWRVVKRFFDTGVMHTDWASRVPLDTLANKGANLVLYQTLHLLKRRPLALGRLATNVVAKYLGYKLGRHYKVMPLWLTLKLTQNTQYWLGQKSSE